MVIRADALFAQIPKHLQAALTGNRRADDAAAGFAASLQYRERHTSGRGKTHAVGLSVANSQCQLLIALFNKSNSTRPRPSEFFEQRNPGYFLRRTHRHVTAPDM